MWRRSDIVGLAEDIAPEGGRTMRVYRRPGRGLPLVLLHGLLADGADWQPLIASTSQPVVAFDLPGFGGSPPPERACIDAYADGIVAGLRQLRLRSCAVVGHSLGGAVATAVAERYPDVESLVLLAPAGFGRIRLAEVVALPGVLDAAMAVMPLALANPLAVTGIYSSLVANGRFPDLRLVERTTRRALSARPGVRAATLALARAGRSPKAFHHRRVAFDGPVAAVWGEADRLVPVEHADALQWSLPQAHVEIWSGMGHHPQRERPQALSRFVASHAPANASRWVPGASAGDGLAA